MEARFVSVTPLIPTGGSLEEAIRFYTEHLGFRVAWQGAPMAGIERDGVAFNLIENSDKAWAENSSFSIGVVGLEDLYREIHAIPAQVGRLEKKAWGRVEFHLVAPSGVCLQFYEREGA